MAQPQKAGGNASVVGAEQQQQQQQQSSASTSINKTNFSGLSREQKQRLLLIEKRRRQVRKAKSACKGFISFLCSQIGLSSLVVAYTILGGIVFRRIESENEQETHRKSLSALNTEVDALIRHFESVLLEENKDDQNKKSALTEELRKYVENNGDGRKIDWITINGTFPDDISKEKASLAAYLESNNFKKYIINETNMSFTAEKENRIDVMDKLGRVRVESYRAILKRRVNESLWGWTKVTKGYVLNDGWTAGEDFKWSIEGSILFAITIITTIGKSAAQET
ncbi:hypothetical protein Ciccas_011730 [Cichlidogyrus casuarinus]|uniref:Uncharacterized protein n=1 Tax=Cichlidogyrus casuarinus TaxID=1844966 RepID=A0ABD2PQE1_9PLAT